jgi:hypothetical protein
LLFTLKNLLMIIYVFKKHENLLKTMKIVEFFFIIWGKWSELEPGPEFLTSWSWSRSRSRTAQKWTGSATLPPTFRSALHVLLIKNDKVFFCVISLCRRLTIPAEKNPRKNQSCGPPTAWVATSKSRPDATSSQLSCCQHKHESVRRGHCCRTQQMKRWCHIFLRQEQFFLICGCASFLKIKSHGGIKL